MIVFDDDVRGLGVRVTAAGAKVFLFEYWRAGRTHRMRIAPYGRDCSLAQARKRASTLRGEVAAGRHPADEAKAEKHKEDEAAAARKRQVEVDRLTFSVLIDRWEQAVLSDRRPRYRGEATRALRLNFMDVTSKPAQSIDLKTAREVLDRVQKVRGAIMARRSHAYARAMFGWAKRQGLVSDNPFAGVAVEGREASRDRVLTDIELGEVWRAAGVIGWPYGGFFRFLILTLQREAETAGLRRSELSQDLTAWVLPGTRTKNHKPHIVHLVETARDILRAAPQIRDRRASRVSDLVFTTTGSTPLNSFGHAKQRVDLAIEAERARQAERDGSKPEPLVPWRLHDLRRTGVSTLASFGVRVEVADKILNHQQGAIKGVAAVYQRYEFLPEREAALRAWGQHVLAVGEGQDAAENVFPLRAGGVGGR